MTILEILSYARSGMDAEIDYYTKIQLDAENSSDPMARPRFVGARERIEILKQKKNVLNAIERLVGLP